MRILLFGRYDPTYSRNRILIKGLIAAGGTVVECRTLVQLFRIRGSYDVVLAMFPAQRFAFLARLVAGRRPLIVDAFTSHYEGAVLDRRTVHAGSISARWYRFLDRFMCRLADGVLTDTKAHADWFAREYRISRHLFYPVFVGADPSLFSMISNETLQPFTVHFHGTYIPLQGVRYILDAAEILKNEDIQFRFVGSGQTYTADRDYAHTLGLRRVTFLPKVSYARLSELISRSHVCLGIFGTTPKTARVIPNKAFEAMAAARPLITADTPAIRELLDERSAVLVPAGDPRALASAIMTLYRDSKLRDRIGRTGHAVLLARATPDIIGRSVTELIQRLFV
jgi:glycosyltransferase involved in cell wall biosynthesis